jgi:hypothetical protein
MASMNYFLIFIRPSEFLHAWGIGLPANFSDWIDHYKKYENFKPQLECCICDKSIYMYSQRFVGILDDKIDMLNIYINQILQIEKN